jgi:hypothetical protein
MEQHGKLANAPGKRMQPWETHLGASLPQSMQEHQIDPLAAVARIKNTAAQLESTTNAVPLTTVLVAAIVKRGIQEKSYGPAS